MSIFDTTFIVYQTEKFDLNYLLAGIGDAALLPNRIFATSGMYLFIKFPVNSVGMFVNILTTFFELCRFFGVKSALIFISTYQITEIIPQHSFNQQTICGRITKWVYIYFFPRRWSCKNLMCLYKNLRIFHASRLFIFFIHIFCRLKNMDKKKYLFFSFIGYIVSLAQCEIFNTNGGRV